MGCLEGWLEEEVVESGERPAGARAPGLAVAEVHARRGT